MSVASLPPPPPPALMTERDAAAYMAISSRTLWTLRKRGDIHAVKVGGRSIRYPVEELRKYIDRQLGEGDAQ